MSKPKIAAVLVAAAVLAGAAPAPAGAQEPAATARHRRAVAVPLARAIHGELIVPDGEGGFREVTFDRGRLTTDGDRVTVARRDGRAVTATLTGDTRYRGVSSAGDVRDGRPGLLISEPSGNALVVAQPTERQGRRIERLREQGRRRDGKETPPTGVAPDEGQVPAA